MRKHTRSLFLFIWVMAVVLGSGSAQAEDGTTRSRQKPADNLPTLPRLPKPGQAPNTKIEYKNRVESKTDFKMLTDEEKAKLQKKRQELILKVREEKEALREKFQTEIQTMRVGVRERIAEWKANQLKNETNPEKKQLLQRIIEKREKFLQGGDNRLATFKGFAASIGAQITIHKEKGADVAEAQELLNQALEKIEAATTKIAELNTTATASIDTVSTETKRKMAQLVKGANLAEIKKLLQDTKEALRKAIKAKARNEATVEVEASTE